MKLFTSRILRRVIALLWHCAGLFLAYALAFALRFDFAVPDTHKDNFWATLPVVFGVFLVLTIIFRLYRGLWTYFSFPDAVRYAAVFALGSLICGAIVYFQRGQTFAGFPRSVLFTNLILLLSWEIGGRGVVRLIRQLQSDYLGKGGEDSVGRHLVVGSLQQADSFLRAFRSSPGRSHAVAVLTDDPTTGRSTIHGARVYPDPSKIGQIVQDLEIETVMILPPDNSPKRMADLVDACSESGANCQFRVIPSMEDLASGKLDISSLRKVEIEDLLHRKPNQFDHVRVGSFLKGKTVMVTGAGGSIGSEICRQVAGLGVRRLVLFEQSELALFQIEGELRRNEVDAELIAVSGDVRRRTSIEQAIERAEGVDVVYHAAAYKHVHLMEQNVPACFHNNVIGSSILAEVAKEKGVSKFILISTDKAVRPTSIMGASKRIAERAVLENPFEGTEFLAVRFGNVLGSSGSVIPIFRKQIANGGPVTVTTPDTRRFFMTIPEAVELVLMSGVVGSHQDIMVLEMGEQVKIVDLARRLIELSGLKIGEDIEINFIGLRPGEKEFEELLTEDENVVPTEHDKIWAMQKNEALELANSIDLDRIKSLVKDGDEAGLRGLAKELIAENYLGSETKSDKVPA